MKPLFPSGYVNGYQSFYTNWFPLAIRLKKDSFLFKCSKWNQKSCISHNLIYNKTRQRLLFRNFGLLICRWLCHCVMTVNNLQWILVTNANEVVLKLCGLRYFISAYDLQNTITGQLPFEKYIFNSVYCYNCLPSNYIYSEVSQFLQKIICLSFYILCLLERGNNL